MKDNDVQINHSTLELSVVMPCLNEAETLSTCIKKIKRSFDENLLAGEIIVADNGSTDGSIDIALRHGARVIRVEEKGYGSALMGGIIEARGKYVIMGDADDSYDFLNLMPFVLKLREGYQLVMGNRFKGGIKSGAMPPLHRYLGNPVLTAIGKIFFRSPCSDFHCGLRGFNREAILSLDLRTIGMEFASEIVIKSTLHNLKIAEVPTTLSPDGRSRPPHLRSWRDGWRHLRFMLLYSPKWLFLIPGLVMVIFGVCLGTWLLPGPRMIGKITLDVHTLLFSALAIIVGYQAIQFALFTKIYATNAGLLPKDPDFDLWFSFFTLERGIFVGIIIFSLGVVYGLVTIWEWRMAGFGQLLVTQTLRSAIPAFLLITLGMQTILSSFIYSILGLRQR
jgi:glycosyltransferase involved in cell wall biosynthesis